MGQAQINVRTRACSRTSIARTRQAALTHNVRGKELTENSFYPKITLPTRFSNKHGTLIDNFMCKLTKCTLNTTAGIFTKRLSDHQPYFIFLNTANPKIATPKYIHVNSLNPVAISNFVNGIKLSNIYKPMILFILRLN